MNEAIIKIFFKYVYMCVLVLKIIFIFNKRNQWFLKEILKYSQSINVYLLNISYSIHFS
jgi:hypothetical protein